MLASPRQVSKLPPSSEPINCGASPGAARLVNTCTTEPIASEPYSADWPPRTTSSRSISDADTRLKS